MTAWRYGLATLLGLTVVFGYLSLLYFAVYPSMPLPSKLVEEVTAFSNTYASSFTGLTVTLVGSPVSHLLYWMRLIYADGSSGHNSLSSALHIHACDGIELRFHRRLLQFSH